MSRRIFRLVVPALLVAAGASQIASGTWIHAKALLAQALLEYAWRCTLDGKDRARPWPWADTWPVARLSIPHLDASMIVLAGDTGRTLAFGPGHTHGSAPPGTPGTSIVNGHRDTHFAVLRELQLGDALFVEGRNGRVVRYVVDALEVADSRTTQIRAPDDESALLLITCWPFDALRPGGPMRYVVTARASERSPGLPPKRAKVRPAPDGRSAGWSEPRSGGQCFASHASARRTDFWISSAWSLPSTISMNSARCSSPRR